MKKIIFLSALLTSLSVFAAQPVGLVVDAIGDVSITKEGQPPVAPTLKQGIFLGDVIQTQKTGGVKILFKDDTVLTIKENSKAVISEFLFNPKKNERKAVFDIAYGKIRSVVGRFFGENQPVEIKTPTAVGGIRGTDVAAVVKKCNTKSLASCSTSFYCFNGKFFAANIDKPGQEIQVGEGTFTQIIGGNNPTPVAPIPQDILRNNGTTFDISLTSGEEESSQLASLTTSDIASQANQSAAMGLVASLDSSLFASEIRANSAAASILNDSPTAATNLGVQILPGNQTQATNPVTINIIIP